MRVAFIRQPWEAAFPPSSSIAIWTCEVARRLYGSCEVVTYAKRSAGQPPAASDQGLQYRLIETRADQRMLSLLEYLAKYRHGRFQPFASRFYYLGYSLQIARDIRAQGYDIVHIHNFSQFAPVIRAFNPRVRIVLHMHCGWLSQLDRAMIERRLRAVDLIIGCSDYITGNVARRFPQFASRCRTVFNGVDPQRFCRSDDQLQHNGNKQLLFVGRISPEKGVHVLVDAFRDVAARYPHARLKIVGPAWQAPKEFITASDDTEQIAGLASFYDGRSYLDHVKERLPSDLAERVTFTGFVDPPQLHRQYQEADVLINPSLNEPFGMSLVEAMAAEVPVVATRVGGMPEIVDDGRTGLLVAPGDAHELAGAILRILADEQTQRTMGASGRQHVLERFSWDQIAACTLRHYQQLRSEP